MAILCKMPISNTQTCMSMEEASSYSDVLDVYNGQKPSEGMSALSHELERPVEKTNRKICIIIV